LFSFPLTLFVKHQTNSNTDGLCPSVYSRGKVNCPPRHCSWNITPTVIPTICVRRCILKAKGIVPLNPWHCSWNITLMAILMVCVRRCIPDAKGTVTFSLALFRKKITHEYVDSLIPSVYFKGEENYSLHMSVMAIKVYWLRCRFLDGVKWTVNSNALIINAFSIVDYLLFYQWNHGCNEKIQKSFWNFRCEQKF
jgi:hypothetical protein